MFTKYTVDETREKSALTVLHYANGNHPIELYTKGNNFFIVPLDFPLWDEADYFSLQ